MSHQLTARDLKDIPLEMISRLAMGIEKGEDVAFSYGISASQFKQLQLHRPFVLAVERQKAEYEKTGFTVKLKAVLMVEPLMDKYFRLAMEDRAPHALVGDVLKFMTKIGDLEPRGVVAANNAGPGFSISINIPNYVPPEKAIVIDPKDTLDIPVFGGSNDNGSISADAATRHSDAVDEAGGSPVGRINIRFAADDVGSSE